MSLPPPEPGRPCWWGYWIVHPIPAVEPHYVALLYCLDSHLHDALLTTSYDALRRLMHEWEEEHYGPLPLLRYDFVAGFLDWPDGRRWPMRDH